jgi:hypothetical protein
VTFSWQGDSGRWYEFDVARAKRAWDREGGVYAFVKPGEPPPAEAGGPVALYIARTHDFSIALARHDMWAAAQQLGAAEIHLIPIHDEAARLEVERDLIAGQTPILNRQLRRAA